MALTSGFANPTPLAGGALGLNLGEGVELIKKYVEPRAEAVSLDIAAGHAGESLQLLEPGFVPNETAGFVPAAGDKKEGCGRSTPEVGTICYFPAVSHAVPTLGKILLSLGFVAVGYAAAILFCIAFYKNKHPKLVGLTERSRIARGGYLFLKNKYYLDVLYQNVFVYFVSRPLAKATYWFNQNVIDAAVDGVGAGGKRAGEFVYNNIDQKLVDGAVNASGTIASETGHGLQPIQSGRVNHYASLLFGAAAVGAIVLVILNVS